MDRGVIAMTTAAPVLNPAQKAWITRRAKMAARASTAVTPAPSVARPPFTPIEIPVNYRPPQEAPAHEPWAGPPAVSLYVDDNVVGSGARVFVVLGVDDRLATLFSPSQLITTRVARKYLEKRFQTKGVNAKRVAAIIRRNVALADRINGGALKDKIADGGADAVRALELVEARS